MFNQKVMTKFKL